MFESNFPVDRRGCSYLVLWNAFKKIGRRGYDADEQRRLFHDTAATAYQLLTADLARFAHARRTVLGVRSVTIVRAESRRETPARRIN